MKVNNAFIELFLKKIIYIKLSSNVKLFSNQTLLICRNFCDLKQAVKNWYKRCVHEYRKLDFEQTLTDLGILRNKKWNIFLLLYIDNIFITVKIKK